jgi:hypothetical protein
VKFRGTFSPALKKSPVTSNGAVGYPVFGVSVISGDVLWPRNWSEGSFPLFGISP